MDHFSMSDFDYTNCNDIYNNILSSQVFFIKTFFREKIYKFQISPS